MVNSSQTKMTQTTTTVDNALDLALQKITEVEVPQDKHIALAYSGGLDSTVCLLLAKAKGRAPESLGIAYGQPHDVELAYAARQCARYVCSAMTPRSASSRRWATSRSTS